MMNLSVTIKNVEIGGSFGCAIDLEGRVWSWGSNTTGELGVGDYNQRNLPCQVGALAGK
jgi:alpha-tubulin suppressor-like RCC1 family protein